MSFTGSPLPPKRGRPKSKRVTTRIRLETEVFDTWNLRKDYHGFGDKSHSDFAKYLLANTPDRVDEDIHLSSLSSGHRFPCHSTPAGKLKPGDLPCVFESPIFCDDEDVPIDITGHSSFQSQESILNMSQIEHLSISINPEFGVHSGDPSSDSSNESLQSDDGTSNYSLSSSQSSEGIETTTSESDSSFENEFSSSEIDSEETLSAFEDSLLDNSNVSKGEEGMDVSDPEDVEEIHLNQFPVSEKEWKNNITGRMKEEFNALCRVHKSNIVHEENYWQARVVVDVSLLLDIFSKGCQVSNCGGTSQVERYSMESGGLKISWMCSNGHTGFWTSSKLMVTKSGQEVFVNSLLIASGIYITGNLFDKVALFCKFIGLKFISKSTFQRIQGHYVIPEVMQFWDEMKSKIWQILGKESLILGGDGRSDSPGFSAKYCVYILMEQFIDIIVDLEVIDKRETSGVSTNMEVEAVKRLLERIAGKLVVSEIVTDASAAVIALVRRLKVKYPTEFSDLYHALDIWHKSVKITKKLTKAAKVKGCEAINEWCEPIRNHFWYITQNCNGGEQLKDSWLGVIHHVAGEYEWAEGECQHGPLVDNETNKTCLHKNSKALEAIRKVVMDPRILKSLHHYVTFRHTGSLENFNSMALKYAPKRVGFQNDSFTGRSVLAAIDHNTHAFRKQALKKNGEPKYDKVYSKRSKNWKLEVVKEDKTYNYWPTLASRILAKRASDEDSLHKKVNVPASHPKNIAPSIALTAIPQTSDLIKKSLSRFVNKESQINEAPEASQD